MSKNKPKVSVIGAGLAGCEAAYQLAERGIAVSLYKMKPEKFSPAHKLNGFCELVCSNSLRSDRLQNGAGLLKEEMRRLGSIVMQCAEGSRVPAGGALAVDRDIFSELVTKRLSEHENITIEHGEVTSLPDAPAIVATGPLTDGAMLEAIEAFFGEGLHFYDAVAPVISAESLDMSKIFEGSRYERGNDYLNCPMDKEEYFTFINNLITAETAPLLFIRPISGSGALAVGSEIMRTHGVDSYIGRVAAVMLGSSETTFYTVAVYYGAAGITKTRYTIPAALCADAAMFLSSAFFVRLFFGA